MAVIQRISPCLWFDDQAEEAATFYAPDVLVASQLTPPDLGRNNRPAAHAD